MSALPRSTPSLLSLFEEAAHGAPELRLVVDNDRVAAETFAPDASDRFGYDHCADCELHLDACACVVPCGDCGLAVCRCPKDSIFAEVFA